MASDEALPDHVFGTHSHPAFYTSFFDYNAILWKLETCKTLCTLCRETLRAKVIKAFHASRHEREYDRIFHGIRLDLAVNEEMYITTRNCPLQLSMETAVTVMKYQNPTWWPDLVKTYTNTLKERSTTRLRRTNNPAETEWSLKLWLALDGTYTIDDAVFRKRDRLEWETRFALYLQAATSPSLKRCDCEHRWATIPPYYRAWVKFANHRRKELRPWMEEFAPSFGESFRRFGYSNEVCPEVKSQAMQRRGAVMKDAMELLGKRGEWLTGRMERWASAHPNVFLTEMSGDEGAMSEAVCDNQGYIPYRPGCAAITSSLGSSPVDSSAVEQRARTAGRYQGSLPRPRPLRGTDAELRLRMQRSIESLRELTLWMDEVLDR